MKSHAIIGLGFGDEGKGVVTDYLCAQDPGNTLVVRFSGGHQCGHKVVRGYVEHVFSNFGSGTLNGCPTYWSRHCTFEPVGFWREYMLLREQGVDPRIHIHPECPVTTVYDVFVNRNSVEVEHGTTGTGFFRTKKRHLEDGVALSVVACLLNPWDAVLKTLDAISDYYALEERLDIGPFVEACFEVRKLVEADVVHIDSQPPWRERVVFEGSQGLMLDERIGVMPHCTPSDVTPQNALEMVDKLDEVWLVSRVYQTRHGNGPMTNTQYSLQLTGNEKETNKLDKHQGEFRVSILDLDQLMHAKEKGIDKVVPASTKVNLVMTCADQMRPYKVSVAGNVVDFDDVDEFVRLVGEALKIDGDLYMNRSPFSAAIRKVAGDEGRKP